MLKKRDSNGRYDNAKNDLTLNFAGTFITYEEPSNPELVIDT